MLRRPPGQRLRRQRRVVRAAGAHHRGAEDAKVEAVQKDIKSFKKDALLAMYFEKSDANEEALNALRAFITNPQGNSLRGVPRLDRLLEAAGNLLQLPQRRPFDLRNPRQRLGVEL